MKYIVGYDGGGTKTHIGIFTLDGTLVYESLGLGSNHAASDGAMAHSVIESLLEAGLKALKIKRSDIAYIYLGLSGADTPGDYAKIDKMCAAIFKDIPYSFDNDAWIIMRSGLDKPYGAVAISGTGTNAAAINKQGEKTILRSLGYTLGIYGGGLDIAREGLHYAFRADELTYKETILKSMILKHFSKETMDEVVKLFYPKQQITKQDYGTITGLVFEACEQHDEVACEILRRVGQFIGLQTAGVLKQLAMEKDNVPVVTGGRVLEKTDTILYEMFKETLKHECPNIHLVKPAFKPVVGAFLSALDHLNKKQTKTTEQNLLESGCGL